MESYLGKAKVKSRSKNFSKLGIFIKFLRPINLIFIINYNFSCNLKIGYFGPKLAILGLLTIMMSQSLVINCSLRGLKVTLIRKNETNWMYFGRVARWQHYLVTCLKTLFYNIVVRLSPAFLGPEGALEQTEGILKFR